jgi:hypothetical protein
VKTIIRRLWLFVRIVGRENQADQLTSPAPAWQIACIVWPRNTAIRNCQLLNGNSPRIHGFRNDSKN